MTTGTGITILAAWIYASACACAPLIQEKEYNRSKKIAWAITIGALIFELATKLTP